MVLGMLLYRLESIYDRPRAMTAPLLKGRTWHFLSKPLFASMSGLKREICPPKH